MPPVTEDDLQWYEGQPQNLTTLVRRLENHLSTERFIDGAITRIYYGQGILPVGMAAPASSVPLASMFLRALDALVEDNALKAVMDTAASMIVRQPAYKIITTGGSWKKQVAARRMSRLLTGVYSASGLRAATTPIVLDSMRCLMAGSKWSIGPTGKIRSERVLPHTLIYNPAEGPRPRNLYQRHGVPRGRLMRMKPEHALKLRSMPAYKPDPAFHVDTWSYSVDRDLVEVVEGWRVLEDDDVGRHVMVCGDIILEDEPWDLPVTPIVPLTWGDSYDTAGGDPLGRQLLSGQRTLSRMDRMIDEAQTKGCPPKLLVPKGSDVTGWDNSVGSRIDYVAAAGKPEVVPGAALPPEYYQRYERKRSSMFELAGVSYGIASGTKEPGLTSGRAQRDRYDIANSRLVLFAQRLERWFEDNGTVAMALMRKAYGSKSMRILAPNTALLEEIDWKEIGDIKEDEVQVRAYITSAIPLTPAARAESLAERVEAGVMTQRRAARWYSDPDLAQIEDEESAAEDLARKMVDSALDDGKYIPPETIQGPEGLAMVVEIGGAQLMKALCLPDPPPPANLELVRRLIEQAKLAMQAVAPPAPVTPQLAPVPGAPPPMPGAPAGAPGAAPGAVVAPPPAAMAA